MRERVVLLVFPHFRPYSKWSWLPTSFIFMASVLKANGYNPILVDDRFNRGSTLTILDEYIDDAVLVGIAAATGSQLRNARQLAAWCKTRNPDIPVVFGGSFPSVRPHLTLTDPNIDIVVQGQGEWMLHKLCETFYLNHAHGYPVSYGIFPPAPVNIAKLPPLPYFDSEFMDVADYLNPETMAVNYATSSGCVGSCGFCYWHDSYRYSRLSKDRVLSDLWGLKDVFGIRNVQFDDGTFFVGRDRTMDIVRGLKGMELGWRANARLDLLNLFEPGDWGEIAESGCHLMHIGLEHASTRILNIMNKHIRPSTAIVAIRRAREVGIKLRFHILLGNPTETTMDLESVGWWLGRMLEEDSSLDYTVNWFTPYPGCAMTELAKRHGYEESETLEGFERMELVNYVNLPEDDRQIIKETSPWDADYNVPWFTSDQNEKYMRVFREVVPERRTIETTGGKRESVYEA